MTDQTRANKIIGQCLCGDVQFEINPPEGVDVCHCKMCRNWLGGPFIGVDVQGGIHFNQDSSLTWYESSEWAKRGFCKTCGSSLFYTLKENPDFWSVTAGSLDLSDGLHIGKEIFIDEKPDYYDFTGQQTRMTGAEFFAHIQGMQQDDS